MTTKSPTKSATKKRDVNAEITQRFIDAIESGVSPFQVPWSSANGMPRNFSGNVYRGINFFLTLLYCFDNNWETPVFMTYKQAKDQGYQVKKGSKSVHVSYSSMTVPQKYKDNPESCPSSERYFFRKLYSVFNVAQIDGIDLEKFKINKEEFQPDEQAQSIVTGYTNSPLVKHEGTRAFFDSRADVVTMPAIDRFHNTAGYYEVLFHELGHSTGHTSRLDRPLGNKKSSDEYAFEELIAELTASFLCAESGILEATFENSASYLEGWLQSFKSDSSYLLKAAAKAQLAADHILGRSFAAKEVKSI